MTASEGGTTSDAVVVEGSGLSATITAPVDAEFAALERTVVTEGTGAVLHAGDVVRIEYRMVDGVTGETLDASDRYEGGAVWLPLDYSNSIFLATLECAPLGSEAVLAVPGEMLQGGEPIVVYATALEQQTQLTAQGEPVAPVEGMPAVTLDSDGAPQITIPETDAPGETRVELLQQGDGETVAPGDTVVVQYRGVKWADGEEFDSSWSRGGVPSSFPTTGVVTGFRLALEGQQVGSQVLVVMPPADGYGAVAGHELEHDTLVFVVDIIATTSEL